MAAQRPRVVIVRRQSAYEALLERHATHGQAAFYLKTRGQDIAGPAAEQEQLGAVLDQVVAAVPDTWRHCLVGRGDLDRFLFEPNDIVVALGQDGLVANLAKYLTGQPVIGLNPLPELYDGVLVRHGPAAAGELFRKVAGGNGTIEARTMVKARLDDGQELLALNEIFLGHESHQSARYELSCDSARETQSSSGLIVASGTGATGWARSIHLARASALRLPGPEEATLVFFVREAFPSIATGTDLVEGLLSGDLALEVCSQMTNGVLFGDGIESDRLAFGWGQSARIKIAERRLNLVCG